MEFKQNIESTDEPGGNTTDRTLPPIDANRYGFDTPLSVPLDVQIVFEVDGSGATGMVLCEFDGDTEVQNYLANLPSETDQSFPSQHNS